LKKLKDGKLEEKAKAAVLLMRLPIEDSTSAEDRKSWSYQGIVAYSKICTHVGCPVALYEQHTHHLLCPCHQSQFDVSNQCEVIFGPAARPLPQLPITVDAEGYLVAQSDFTEPVGPSYWERSL
jgi:ubiquinol-cytochrome c reductase iron-sulfur subunit